MITERGSVEFESYVVVLSVTIDAGNCRRSTYRFIDVLCRSISFILALCYF